MKESVSRLCPLEHPLECTWTPVDLVWSLGRQRWALERRAGEGCWGTMCCAENAGWKKSEDASGWHSLPASPSQDGNSCDEEQGLFVLPSLVWRGKTQELFGSLSVHFLFVFSGEKQVERTGASVPKPLLRITAWDAQHC